MLGVVSLVFGGTAAFSYCEHLCQHGVGDCGINGTGRCLCENGWYGVLCEIPDTSRERIPDSTDSFFPMPGLLIFFATLLGMVVMTILAAAACWVSPNLVEPPEPKLRRASTVRRRPTPLPPRPAPAASTRSSIPNLFKGRNSSVSSQPCPPRRGSEAKRGVQRRKAGEASAAGAVVCIVAGALEAEPPPQPKLHLQLPRTQTDIMCLLSPARALDGLSRQGTLTSLSPSGARAPRTPQLLNIGQRIAHHDSILRKLQKKSPASGDLHTPCRTPLKPPLLIDNAPPLDLDGGLRDGGTSGGPSAFVLSPLQLPSLPASEPLDFNRDQSTPQRILGLLEDECHSSPQRTPEEKAPEIRPLKTFKRPSKKLWRQALDVAKEVVREKRDSIAKEQRLKKTRWLSWAPPKVSIRSAGTQTDEGPWRLWLLRSATGELDGPGWDPDGKKKTPEVKTISEGGSRRLPSIGGAGVATVRRPRVNSITSSVPDDTSSSRHLAMVPQRGSGKLSIGERRRRAQSLSHSAPRPPLPGPRTQQRASLPVVASSPDAISPD
eukprot:Hpha_TRINITY_DN24997_c0_g1::TRINITY_DN24997_c0_g1_i1::g.111196::m.111196